jgi:hypothetical protein
LGHAQEIDGVQVTFESLVGLVRRVARPARP